ncbi:MAG: S-layer homology domain-containing protein [Synergistaceae bacterium]|nr:S-layer homology domain-containing protein [Synergistaceae bacterium]
MRKVTKKFSVTVSLALCVVVAAASASFAATGMNPFMDVPMNHWAYDAIGQLAARGVLSGYPDGTYKGKQPTSRYEMASAVARALALTDLSKAAKQDVETLKKLIEEFQDELDTLGVKTDELDVRVGAMESRLGGWKIGGELRLDLENWKWDNPAVDEGSLALSRARLELHRWFGVDEGIYFYARLEENEGNVIFDKFYADIPFAGSSVLTAGRFDRDFEGDYRFQIGGATDIANDAWFSDRTVDGLGFAKSFGAGSVNFYAARPFLPGFTPDEEFEAWELHLFTQFQFSERFGFDIGAQYFHGDDASIIQDVGGSGTDDWRLNSAWTLYGGLRFNFNPNISLKGLYAYQDSSAETSPLGSGLWQDLDADSAKAWKVIVDVKQELLKFTSLWLEYGRLDEGFYIPYNNTTLTLVDEGRWNIVNGGAGAVEFDMDIWRVGAIQQWNDKWFTWLYAAGHELTNNATPDYKGLQWGLGVEYRYNENVAFALNYIKMDWDDDAETDGFADANRIQLRTSVTF